MATFADLNKYYLAYFGRPVDYMGAKEWATKSNAEVEAAFAASSESKALYASSDLPGFINNVYTNVIGRAAEKAGLDYWVNQILTGKVTQAGAAMAILGDALLTGDKAAVQNKLTAAENFYNAIDTAAEAVAYSGTAAAASARAFIAGITSTPATADQVTTALANVATAAASGSGSTFTLTTGVDQITGTSGNDTLIADNTGTNAQLSVADQIDAGAGTDTLKVYLKATHTSTGQPTLTGIEAMYINGGAITAYTAATGTTSLYIDSPVVNTAATYTLNGQELTLKGHTVTANTTTTVAAAATATATTQKITLDGQKGSTATKINTIDVTGTKITTIDLVTSGNASTITLDNSGGAAVRTVNLSGDKDLTLALAAAPAAAITKVNASTATGKMSVNTSAGTVAGTFTFTGGSGNDTVTFADNALGTLVAGTQLDGGNGTDKIGTKDTAFTATEIARINAAKNFEVLGLNDSITVDASTLTSIKDFSVDTAAKTLVLNNLKTGSSATMSASTASLTLGAGTGVHDVTVNMGVAGAAGVTATTLVTTGLETVALNSNGTSANTITTLTNSENSTITIKGATDLTITNKLVGTTAGSVVNAADFTGKLSLIGSVKNDVITGGSGDDTIQVGAGATTAVAGQADTLKGNGGADIFKFVEADAANAATAFAALLKQSAGTSGIVKITDFQAGVDKIHLQSDQTTGGAAVAGTSIVLSNAQTITTADTLTAVYAGITALAGSTAGGALAGVVVTVSAGAAAGTYLYIDDATGGVNSTNDMLINLTGISGTLSANDFTFA